MSDQSNIWQMAERMRATEWQQIHAKDHAAALDLVKLLEERFGRRHFLALPAAYKSVAYIQAARDILLLTALHNASQERKATE